MERSGSEHVLRAVEYVQVAGLTILVYDWITLLFDEINLFWSTKWSIVKILYFVTRYSVFIDVPLNVIYYTMTDGQPDTCRLMYQVIVWASAIGLALAELVLIVRTYAIYESSRKVLVTLLIIWVAWVGGNTPVTYLFAKSLRYGHLLPSGPSSCHIERASTILFVSFASFLCFEIVIVVMTVVRWYRRMRGRINHSSPVIIAYRDSVAFFLILMCCSLANVLLLVLAPTDYVDLLNTLTRVIHSLLCCRILINIRMAASLPDSSQLPDRTVASEHFSEFGLAPGGEIVQPGQAMEVIDIGQLQKSGR